MIEMTNKPWGNVEKILQGKCEKEFEEFLMEENIGMSMWLANIKLSKRKKKILGE